MPPDSRPAGGTETSLSMRVWIDIENPPQVQYLLPLRAAFAARGSDTVITARDYGHTVEMLGRAGVVPWCFGKRVGRSTVRKCAATVRRTRELEGLFDRVGRPDVLVAASRAAPLAAWRMGIPSFLIIDYEHVYVGLFRIDDPSSGSDRWIGLPAPRIARGTIGPVQRDEGGLDVLRPRHRRV
jgi:hypothetical protein